MTLSWGSCLITSCATVSPPMPESKTPTGAVADLDVTMPESPADRRAHRRAATRHDAHREAGRNVPQVRRDEGVGAGEKMIRHDDGHPILDVRVARPDLVG